MIAYALLRIAARRHCVKISILRFTDLVALCLFQRRHLGAIDKPRPSTQAARNAKTQKSIQFHLCLSFPGQPCPAGGENAATADYPPPTRASNSSGGCPLIVVEAGEELIITRHGRAVAHIHPVSRPKQPPRLDDLAVFRVTMPRLRGPSAELLREARDEAL